MAVEARRRTPHVTPEGPRRPSGLTIHIGPGKTGSTSVQTALRSALDDLAAAGIVIPQPGFSTNGHLMAAFDYLCNNPANVIPINARGFLHSLGDRFGGSWERLVTGVLGSDGPVIVSQEVLACLNSAGVADLAETFSGIPVRAVAMFRPVSELIPSLYQQEARMMIMPPFEAYVRRCVTLLAAGGVHEYQWMDSSWLRETWEGAGVPLVIVDCGDSLTSDSLIVLMAAILPPGVPLPPVPRENPGLSAYGIDVWCDHLRVRSPTYLAPAMRVFETFCAVDPWATDRGWGGRYDLVEPLAELLDAMFPSASRSAPGDQSGQIADGVRQEDARRQLLELIASDGPLTQRLDGLGPDPEARMARARASLARRQRQDDLIWGAANLVRRAQGRPRPIAADWVFDAPVNSNQGP